MDIIREDTYEIKEKYGDDRRTRIEGAATDMNYEDLIAQEDMVVTVSHEGYIKRLPVSTYRSQGRGGRGIKGTESKEGDFVEHLFVANTHDYLLFFTNQGRAYERRVYDVPQMSRTSQGRSIANLLEFQAGEKIANVLAIKDFGKEEQFLMFATQKGVVKKTALTAYANIRQNGIIAIGLEDGDELIGVEITSGADQVLLGTRHGMAIRFNETDVRAMGRPAAGVTGIRFKKEGDEVVSMIVAPAGRDETTCMVLTACVNGFGKRTPVEDYRLIRRGGKGVINIKTTDRNGDVVGMQAVCDEDELMLITEKGILIRTRVSEIRETGRNAAGVKLIKLDEGDKLVAMAKVDALVVKAEAAADDAEAAATGGEPANRQAWPAKRSKRMPGMGRPREPKRIDVLQAVAPSIPQFPLRRGDRVGSWVAWIVIILAVTYGIVANAVHSGARRHLKPGETFDPAKVPTVELLMTGRTLVGSRIVLTILQSAQGMKNASVNASAQANIKQVKDLAISPLEKLRAATVLAELAAAAATPWSS